MAIHITKAMAWLARDGVELLPATVGYVSDIKTVHAGEEAHADFSMVTRRGCEAVHQDEQDLCDLILLISTHIVISIVNKAWLQKGCNWLVCF